MNNNQIDSFNNDHLEMLAQIASMYYEEDLDQAVIAEKIGRSRSMVSRLLREVRERGLIDIKVKWPFSRNAVLEKQLCEMYGLKDAWVLSSSSQKHPILLRGLGELGAKCLQTYLKEGIRIGIGWGKTLQEVVKAMPAVPLQEGGVVQLLGAVGRGDPMAEGAEIVRSLAQKLGVSYRYLSTPIIVDNEIVAIGLQMERTIKETFEAGRNVNVALLGIGALEPVESGLYRTGHVTDEDVRNFRALGAVGDLLARHIDREGRLLDVSLNRRVMSQTLDDLKAIQTVIGVAQGEAKIDAIAAVMKGKYINVLVTDSATSRALLQKS